MKVDPESWPTVSRLMDEWLDLPAEQRPLWLENLGPEHAKILPVLRELLSEPEGGFLQTLPGIEDDSSLAPTPTSLAEGALVGPYRLVRELGHGGMGVVWLAVRSDGTVKRDVAIKFPHFYLQSQTLTDRFARERDILARLADARIARLYDAGVTALGQPYLVLEYVEGEPITTYCDRLCLDIRARLRLFLDVLRAVQYAHTNLVVHRDLKPSNILVTKAAEVRLLDFGIAKLLDEGEAHETEITRSGGRALTPDFASPEQLTGGAITTATDVYSLGILLYELLTGARPYKVQRTEAGSMSQSVLTAEPARPSQAATEESAAVARGATVKKLDAELRGDLDTITLKAIQKEPQCRYATADAFAQDIERHLNGQPVLARPESRWYRARKFVLRNKLAVASAVAIALALTVGAGIALWQKKRADTEAATARAVSEFLQKDVLAQAAADTQAGPGRRPDPDIKVRTALDRAAARIAGKFDAQPAVEAAIRETIGTTYLSLGLFAQAQQQMERALDLRRHVLGPEHPETIGNMVDLAEILRTQGKYAAAENLFTAALEVNERRHRDEDKATLGARNGLALLAMNPHSDFRRAEELDSKNLEVQRRVLGEADPMTLATMNNLAALLVREGKFGQAEVLYKQVVDVKKRVLGEDHPSTLISMNGLAVLYRNQGRYPEAEALMKTLLATRRRISGDRHRDTLVSQSALGIVYLAAARYDDAEALLTPALDSQRKILGEHSPETLTTMLALAELHFRRGESDQARTLLEQLLLNARASGPNAPMIRSAESTLGRIELRQHSYAKAEALFRDVLESYRKSNSDIWSRYAAECQLGASLAGLGRHAEAAPLLAEGYRELLERRDSVPFDYRTILDEARHWAERETARPQ